MPFSPYYFLNFKYLLFVAPALILAALAQIWIRSAYARGQSVATNISGFLAARKILDAAGLHDIPIEEVPGQLTDHYDPRNKVLRLSSENYHGRNLAAVGVAAHETGHALQDAHGYVLMTLRNLAVPAANFGSGASMFLFFLGAILSLKPLIWLGIIAFSGVVIFQVVNLPVEFNASSRAKALLVQEGIVHQFEMGPVNNVLSAAALTYVAATLQSILTLLYYVSMFMGDRRDR